MDKVLTRRLTRIEDLHDGSKLNGFGITFPISAASFARTSASTTEENLAADVGDRAGHRVDASDEACQHLSDHRQAFGKHDARSEGTNPQL